MGQKTPHHKKQRMGMGEWGSTPRPRPARVPYLPITHVS